MPTLANKAAPLPPALLPGVILFVAVMLLGTALVGLLTGAFRLNSLGTTTVLDRRDQPVGYWSLFLVLVVGGAVCLAVAASLSPWPLW